MSVTTGSNSELLRALQDKDWDAVDRLVGMNPEEAERILREESFVDAAEVNGRMEELDRLEDMQNGAQGVDVSQGSGKPA